MAVAIRFAVIVAAGLLVAAGPVLAAGGGGKSAAKDPNYTKAQSLIEDGKYADAIPLLMKVVADEPANADAHNYLGYSQRRVGNFDDALKSYRKALRIKPKHRGANEYLGELFLRMDRLDKAEERLAVLDKACFFGCEEFSDLKQAIADYKAKQGS